MPDKLAQSAYELFSERGFDGVTIDDIAAHAGVTKGSFYSHFKSKHEIVLAACLYYYRTYHRQVAKFLANVSEPRARLKCVLEHAVRTCVRDDRVRIFTTEVFALSLQNDEVRRGWAQFYDSVREMYIGLVLALNASGNANVGNAQQTVDLVLAAIEGIKMQAAISPRIGEPGEQHLLVTGLLKIVMLDLND